MQTLYPFMPTCTKMYVAGKWPFWPNILTNPKNLLWGLKCDTTVEYGITSPKKMHLGHKWLNTGCYLSIKC